MRVVAAVVTALVVLAACGGDDDEVTSGTDGTGAPGDTTGQRYTVSATVLESPDHGPQLCLGGVAESLPPQCGGPDITNWSWDDVEADSAQGTTWGDYSLVGTYDAATSAFTLTEPPGAPERQAGSPDDDRLATPCPEPDGGWQVSDPDRVSADDQNAAAAYVDQQPDAGGFWIDWIDPLTDEEVENLDQAGGTPDPGRFVLNATFTGDLDDHDAALRQIWGGPLCVSEAPYPKAELSSIRDEVFAEVPDALFGSVDEVTGRVEITVVLDDSGLQERFDERYGEGVVAVSSALQPVD